MGVSAVERHGLAEEARLFRRAGRMKQRNQPIQRKLFPADGGVRARQSLEETILFSEGALHRERRVDAQWLKFTQMKKAQNAVHISARQDDGGDRSVARLFGGSELGMSEELLP